MGRVTYLHHYVSRCDCLFVCIALTNCALCQLPTLWFAVLAAGHVLDTILFSNRRLPPATRWIAFAIASILVLGVSWWFRAFAFGMQGPVNDHRGLRWRKVNPTRNGDVRFRTFADAQPIRLSLDLSFIVQ